MTYDKAKVEKGKNLLVKIAACAVRDEDEFDGYHSVLIDYETWEELVWFVEEILSERDP
ncbi:hypothetical protein HY493_03425 [Candidatus Woesearchaeota archaeon]|nr:hypothetical protein [Candidatus Woesearchaeota archaeon]